MQPPLVLVADDESLDVDNPILNQGSAGPTRVSDLRFYHYFCAHGLHMLAYESGIQILRTVCQNYNPSIMRFRYGSSDSLSNALVVQIFMPGIKNDEIGFIEDEADEMFLGPIHDGPERASLRLIICLAQAV